MIPIAYSIYVRNSNMVIGSITIDRIYLNFSESVRILVGLILKILAFAMICPE